MRETCLHNKIVFQCFWRLTPRSLLYIILFYSLFLGNGGGGDGVGSPWLCVCVYVCVCVGGGGGGGGGEGGGEGGAQILTEESLSYSLKHISTEEHSLHISWGSTHLLYLYFLFWWQCASLDSSDLGTLTSYIYISYFGAKIGNIDIGGEGAQITGIKASTLIPRQNGRHFAFSSVLMLIQITLNFLQYGGLISVGTGNGLAPNMQQGMTRPKSFNSLRPRDLYMRQYTKPLLLQLMANQLFSCKPLSNAMLAYC